MQTIRETETSSRKREENLSKDGKWRSFPKVPHLLQYVSNGNYYGRLKIGGKLIRESLQTTVWTTAKLRLADFLKTRLENRNLVDPPTFSEVVELFKADIERDTNIKKTSKEYRLRCLAKIQTTWPELWTLRLDAITVEACKGWSARLNKEIASHYFNNTIGTLRQVLQIGIKAHKANGGRALENSAAELKRVRVKQKELRLPEPSVFLCGEFNGWASDATPMKRDDAGHWETTLALAPGRHEYKFLVDGNWKHDPLAHVNVWNRNGTLNSVAQVWA